MSSQSRIIRRKQRLYNQYPFCHWCGIALVLVVSDNGRLPDNAATIDHLRSRFDLTRQEPKINAYEERTVLACYGCNQRRSAEEMKGVAAWQVRQKRLQEQQK